MKYVVKFGDLYSRGRPLQLALTDTLDLEMSYHQRGAWVTDDFRVAAAHAAMWEGMARKLGTATPRVVKLKPRSK